ncbi:MAG: bifunctional biotin--[acetyl-CoA-carboxylase] ligase/biotin operon repressor BirA [Cellvibrionales bacterium]|nr:bifunctional biotin--[acetyl-CoA-carboxylase] ligase/biotin operon repressor BirA [Cellvibrionales bacterium]
MLFFSGSFMSLKIPMPLIELLSDGEFHSGEAIGQEFSISRTAVWKQLKKLEELGLGVASVKGKGYQLEKPIELLNASVIQNEIDAKRLDIEVEVIPSVDSTNTELSRRPHKNKGLLLLAEQQTAGKGRRGRQWQSPFAKNIYLSFAWRFDKGLHQLDGLSLVVGLMVAETVSNMGFDDVSVKWPNDVYISNKKIAGILLEISGDPTDSGQVIIGVGVNVNADMADMSGIDQAWTSLKQESGDMVSRTRWVTTFMPKMVAAIQQFEKMGFAAFAERWEKLDWLSGQQVVLTLGQEQIFGEAKGVTETGALKVEDGGVVKVFTGGEVSIRRSS